MAKKFTLDEIGVGADFWEPYIKGLDEVGKSLVKRSEEQKKFNDEAVKAASILDNSAKSVRDLNNANTKSKASLDAKLKIDQQIVKLEAQKNTLLNEEKAALAGLRLEQQRENKLLKEQAILNSETSTEYEKQSVRLNQLRREYKKLVLAEGGATKETKKLLNEITQLDGRLKAVDKSVGQSQREVGNYGKALGGLKNTLGKLGLAFGAFTIVRDVFKINRDYEESLASLSAITGVVGENFEAFKTNVQNVATETQKSATEVAKAFEIVGSAKPELLANADALAEVTKQSIILSQATKLDLETTSRSLTGTLNQYNLSASEAARVTNALAAGSQAGAAPVNLITESLDKFGTVANSLNISVEQSIGLVETLAEKNITGAEAGTKLRNVLTTIATAETLPAKALEALEKYGVNTSLIADTSVDLSVRLKELSKIQGDVNALNAVFGKENLVVGQTLLKNIDSVQDYTNAVTGTNTATEQAAINQDTLAAIIDKLKAAWEAVVLKFTEGTGSLNVLKAVLKFVADNLEVLLKIVAGAVTTFGIYKTAVKGAEIANKLFNKSINVKNVGRFSAALGIVAFAAYEVFQELTRSTKAEEALSKAAEETGKRLDEEKVKLQQLGAQLNKTTTASRDRQKVLDEINKTYGTRLRNLTDEAAFLRQIEAAYKGIVKQLELRIGIEVVTDELIEAEKEFRGIKRRIESGKGTIDDFLGAEEAEEAVKALRNELALLENRPIGSDRISAKEGADLKGDRFGVEAFEEAENNKKKSTKERIDFSSEEEQRQFEERQQRLKDLADIEKENDQIRIDNAKKTQEEIDRINKQQEEDDKKRLDQERKLEEERRKRQKQAIQDTLDIIKDGAKLIEEQFDRQIEAQKNKISESQSEIQRLEELQKNGDPNAAKALVAEEKAQAREQLKLEKLEKKKRNLQIVITGLERASQLIGNGSSDPFGQSSSEVTGFLGSLPKFFKGTETTVKDALGAPMMKGRDGYAIRVDGKEGILTGEKMDKLRAAGLNTTDEITRAAMLSQSQTSLRPLVSNNGNSNKALIKKLSDVENAIKNQKFPEVDFDMINLIKTVKKGTNVVKTKYTDNSIRF